jgi:hypothetical protein
MHVTHGVWTTGIALMRTWAEAAVVSIAEAVTPSVDRTVISGPPIMAGTDPCVTLVAIGHRLNALVDPWSKAAIATWVTWPIVAAAVISLPVIVTGAEAIDKAGMVLCSKTVVRSRSRTAVTTRVAGTSVDITVAGDPV